MFLNDRLSASNREMVVWEKSFPYILPIARPTSPCVYPNFIRFCLNIFENFSNSSKSVLSSGGKSSLWGSCVDGCKAAELAGINGDRLLGYMLFDKRLFDEKPLPGKKLDEEVVIGGPSDPMEDGDDRCIARSAR